MAKAANGSGQLIYRNSGWHARFYTTIDGERVRVFRALGTHNKQVAKRKLEQLLAAEQPTMLDLKRPETFAEAMERVYEAKKAERPKWAKQGLACLKLYAVDLIGPMPVTAVKRSDVKSVLEAARDKGKSPQSVQHLKQHMSNVFAQLVEEEAISVNPARAAKMPDFAPRVEKQRAVLTDHEFALYLAYEPEDGRAKGATLERQVMACVSRLFGGLRPGDIHVLRWEAFDVEHGGFEWGWAPRKKTKKKQRPQLLEVPEMLRPFLRDWWERAGRPRDGLIFPARKGKRAGQEKNNTSHAPGLRRDLQAAFKVAVERGNDAPKKGSHRWRELFSDGEFTRRVDFYSFRRAFAQALDAADVNAQTAMALTGHSDMAAHARYIKNAGKMRALPAAALPQITISRGHKPVGIVPKSLPSRVAQGGPEPLKTSEKRLTGTDDPGLGSRCSIQLSYGSVSVFRILQRSTTTRWHKRGQPKSAESTSPGTRRPAGRCSATRGSKRSPRCSEPSSRPDTSPKLG